MKISECMTTNPHIMQPEQSLQEAAQVMENMNIGFLPVGQDNQLVGVITDRDIAVRGIGAGSDAATPIQQVMSRDVQHCFEDDNVDAVLGTMGQLQMRRMPVLNRDNQVTGVVSLGDLSQVGKEANTAEALSAISKDTKA
jgi:CBS domain-containing protein